jgi:hypothetical protein
MRRFAMSSIQNSKGIESSDSSDRRIFIRSSIDCIGDVFNHFYKGAHHHDIYGKDVDAISLLAYQFRGHQWTTLYDFWPSSKLLDLQNRLAELSQISSARVIIYTNINTTYEVSYSIYENGQHIETYRCSSDQGLFLDPNKEYPLMAKQDPFGWVDEVLTQEGIFVPLFSDSLEIVPGSGGLYRKGTVRFLKPIRYYADGSCSTDAPDHNPDYLQSDFERVDGFTLSRDE